MKRSIKYCHPELAPEGISFGHSGSTASIDADNCRAVIRAGFQIKFGMMSYTHLLIIRLTK